MSSSDRQPVLSDSPYPGLRSFHREEADIFFGRDEQVDQLLIKLEQRRFIGVVGTSGCGKSSLIRAGLFAALESGFLASAGPRWRIAEMRPGNQPMSRLAQELLVGDLIGNHWLTHPEATAFLGAALRRGPLGLVDVLRESRLPNRTNFLLLVDQFEEIFRFHAEGNSNEAGAFVELLLASARQKEIPIYIVITMRSDFLGECSVFPGLPEAINDGQFLVPRLTREQCRTAIVGPAAAFGGSVEESLVSRILNDMGTDPDQLPLIQHALSRVWAKSVSTARQIGEGLEPDSSHPILLTCSTYEAVGGLDTALSNHADEAIDKLPAEDQRVAEIMFRCLSERGIDRRDTRRPATVAEIAGVAGVTLTDLCRVADVFRQPEYHFLMPPTGVNLRPDTVLDISHESLIRQWKRMARWVEVESESASIYRRLHETAQLWKQGRAAVWRTPDLENALAWRNRENPNATWSERYGGGLALSMEFLEASLEVHVQGEREIEMQRTRELTLTRQVAETERQRADEAERRRHDHAIANQRLRMSLIGIATAGVLSLLLAMTAWTQRNQAESARLIARAEEGRAMEFAQAEALAKSEAEKERANALAHATLEEKHRRIAETALIDMYASQGLSSIRLGDVQEALLWFAKAASESPKGSERERANRIRFRNWFRQLPIPIHATRIENAIVDELHFHPSNQIALIQTNKGAELWDFASGALTSMQGKRALWSHDGSLLAVASPEGTIEIQNFPERSMLHRISLGENDLPELAFDRSGQWLAAGVHSLRVFNLAKGKFVEGESMHPAKIRSIEFTRDSSCIVTSCSDDQGRVWSMDSTQLNREPRFPPVPHVRVGGVGIRPFPPLLIDDRRALFTFDKLHLRLVDLQTGQPGKKLDAGGGVLAGATISDDGSTLAVSSDLPPRIFLHSLYSDQAPVIVPFQERTPGLSLMDSGTILASASHDGKLRFLSTYDGSLIAPTIVHQGAFEHVAFSRKGTLCATVQPDQTVRIFRMPTFQSSTIVPGTSMLGTCHEPTVDREGRILMTPGSRWLLGSTSFCIYEAQTGQPLISPIDLQAGLLSSAVSPNGEYAATLTTTAGSEYINPNLHLREHNQQPGEVYVWKWAQEPRGTHPIATSSVPLDGAFSPDGKLLAVICGMGQLLYIDPETRVITHTRSLKGTADYGYTLPRRMIRFSNDGSRFLTMGIGQLAQIWDRDGNEIAVISQIRLTDAHFSSDGQYLVTSSNDGTVRVWDAKTGQSACEPLVHPADVISAEFDASGTLVATACNDSMARVWNWREQRLVCPGLSHSGHVFSATFANDSADVITAGHEEVRFWETSTGREIGPSRITRVHNALMVAPPSQSRAVIAGVRSSPFAPNVVEVVPTPQCDPLDERIPRGEFLEKLGEIVSGNRVEGVGLVRLTSSEWMDRWKKIPQGSTAMLSAEPVRMESMEMTAWPQESLAERLRREFGQANQSVVLSLNHESWVIASRADAKPEEYARALGLAQRAADLSDHSSILNTLGVAQFRTGNYREALENLKLSEAGNAVQFGTSHPTDVAFIAMTQQKLGMANEAKNSLSRLRELMNDSRWKDDLESQNFWKEAESLIPVQEPESATESKSEAESKSQSPSEISKDRNVEPAEGSEADQSSSLGKDPLVWRSLLIIKTKTAIQSDRFRNIRCRLTSDDVEAVSRAFKDHTAHWISELTGGRLRWEADIAVVEDPLLTISPLGDQCWVSPADVRDDLAQRVKPGEYDSVFFYWKGQDDQTDQTLPAGFGWSIGPSDAAMGCGFSSVHYFAPDAWSLDSEITEVFLHEWLHQAEAFYGTQGVPLPKGGLHGVDNYGFKHDQGWKHWYRAFLNADLDSGDGVKVGLGEAAWRFGTIRDEQRLDDPTYLTAERRARNLLRSGSFERGHESDWSTKTWRSNPRSVSVDSQSAHEGTQSIVIQNSELDDARYGQSVEVKPKTRYLLTGWVRTADISIEKGGSTGANLSIYGGFESSSPTTSAEDWTFLSLKFNSQDRTSVEICARLGHHSSTCTGKAWFDDLCLIELLDGQ